MCSPRDFVPSKEMVLEALGEYGPKAFLYGGLYAVINSLRTIAEGGVVLANEAHHQINVAAVCATTSGWLDFLTTTVKAHDGMKHYEISQGRHYPLGRNGKIAAGLFAAAVTTGGFGLKKSGTPGEELTGFTCAAASGVLAATASIFVKKEAKDLISGKIPAYEGAPREAEPLAQGAGGSPRYSQSQA